MPGRPAPDVVIREYLAAATGGDAAESKLTVVCGGVAAGKTTHRKQDLASAGVLVDAAAIFVSLAPQEVLPFPDALSAELELVGRSLAETAVRRRLPIVTEIIGADREVLEALLSAFTAIGYKVDFVYVHCDPEEAWERNVNRGENDISAYFAEPFNHRWLMSAAQAA